MKITEKILNEVMEADCEANGGESRRQMWLNGFIKSEFLIPILERNLRYLEHRRLLNEGKESSYDGGISFSLNESADNIDDLCNASDAAMAWMKKVLRG